MKRIVIFIFLLLIIFSSAWATGKKEVQTGVVLTLGVQGGDRPATFDRGGHLIVGKDQSENLLYWRDIILAGFPYKVKIRNYAADNTTIKLDADIAGNDAPDVYWDYLGRVNKYANSKFALPIVLTSEEKKDYLASSLSQCTKDGKLYALPGSFWAAVMIVNKTLVDSVGMGSYLKSGSWSIDDFLKVTKAVQNKYDPDYYGYVLFASGTGGDYWSSFGWLSSFGAKLYENGKIVIDSKEGIKALKFMKFMNDTGIAMPGAAGLSYKDNLAAMPSGKIVAAGNSSGAVTKPIKLLDGSGTINAVIMEWPKAPKVEKVPVAVGPDAGMVFASTKHKKEAMELLRYINSTKVQQLICKTMGRFASRKSVGNVLADNPTWVTASDIIARNGIFDTGVGLEKYAEIRNSYPPMLQAIFSGELSVKEAVDRFVNEGNKVINE